MSIFLRNNRGIALLVTLAIITILIAVTLEMNRKMRLSGLFRGRNQRSNYAVEHGVIRHRNRKSDAGKR